jgi:hypothetical protein
MHRADIASHLIYGEDLLMSVRPCKYCTSPSELSGRAGLSVAHLYVHMASTPPGRKGVAAAYQVSWSLFIASSLSALCLIKAITALSTPVIYIAKCILAGRCKARWKVNTAGLTGEPEIISSRERLFIARSGIRVFNLWQ